MICLFQIWHTLCCGCRDNKRLGTVISNAAKIKMSRLCVRQFYSEGYFALIKMTFQCFLNMFNHLGRSMTWSYVSRGVDGDLIFDLYCSRLSMVDVKLFFSTSVRVARVCSKTRLVVHRQGLRVISLSPLSTFRLKLER